MIALDIADLVVIAGRVLGIDTDAALGQLDVAAAQAALAEARPAVPQPDAAFPDRAAAAAGIGLVHALLRHRPFPQHGEQVAVAAGLQFLSLNGWRASLDPPAAAAVVVEALAAGRLSPDSAAAWLLPRLSPSPARRARQTPVRVPLPLIRPSRTLPVAGMPVGRMLMSVVLAIAVGGAALLATACSRGPHAPSAHQGGPRAAVRQSTGPELSRAAELAFAACLRSHGIGNLPYPSASGVVVITPTTGIGLRSAERACR